MDWTTRIKQLNTNPKPLVSLTDKVSHTTRLSSLEALWKEFSIKSQSVYQANVAEAKISHRKCLIFIFWWKKEPLLEVFIQKLFLLICQQLTLVLMTSLIKWWMLSWITMPTVKKKNKRWRKEKEKDLLCAIRFKTELTLKLRALCKDKMG